MSRRSPRLLALPLLGVFSVFSVGLASCAGQDQGGAVEASQDPAATATATATGTAATGGAATATAAPSATEPGGEADDPIVVEIADEQFLTNMAIYTRYVEAKEGPLDLRAPTASAEEIADGKRQEYLTGSIYWSVRTGAQIIRGDILAAYLDAGGPTGPLGWPVGDETVDGEVIYSDFQGGQIRLEDGAIEVEEQQG